MWLSCEKLWKSCEQNVEKFITSHEQVMNKLETSCEQVMKNFWKNCGQIVLLKILEIVTILDLVELKTTDIYR